MNHNGRVRTMCLLLITMIAVGGALYWLRPVMVPFVLALFFALALSPLVDWLQLRLKVPRGLAIFCTVLIGALFLTFLGLLISTSLDQMQDSLPQYQARFDELVDHITTSLPLEKFGFDDGTLLAPIKERSASILLGAVDAIWSVLSLGILVMIFMCFLLAGTPHPTTEGVWTDVKHQVRIYIGAKIAISLATGVSVGVILWILGIDLALVFGLFAFLLNFIPNIGSVISLLLPLPVIVLSPDVSTTTAILAIAVPGALQFSIGNIVEPKILGDSMDLHPVTTLIALIFWGMLWGFVGMVLSVPLTGVLKTVLQRMELTAPIANLLAGRALEDHD